MKFLSLLSLLTILSICAMDKVVEIKFKEVSYGCFKSKQFEQVCKGDDYKIYTVSQLTNAKTGKSSWTGNQMTEEEAKKKYAELETLFKEQNQGQ